MSSTPRLTRDWWFQNGHSRSVKTGIVPPVPREGQKIRILQFGEGRLLRTLIDTAFEEMRRVHGWQGLIAMVNCRPHGAQNIQGLKAQDGLYTALIHDDEQVTPEVVAGVLPYDRDQEWEDILTLAESVEWMVTNATESGIVPSPEAMMPSAVTPQTVVGMVTMALWRRWKANPLTPLTVLPTELLPQNGKRLQSAVREQAQRWRLPEEFMAWVTQRGIFVNTLVDRVVTGPPEPVDQWWQKLGYQDRYLTVGEHYGRWWIEATGGWPDMPLEHVSTVQFVDRLDGYHQLKVLGLNGVHLLIACKGLLHGYGTVQEAFADPAIQHDAEAYWVAVKPVISLPQTSVEDFLNSLRHRFGQQWLHHRLEDIAVRLVDKWWIRIAPSMDWWWTQKRSIPQALVGVTDQILQYLIQTHPTQWTVQWIEETFQFESHHAGSWRTELVRRLHAPHS